MNKPFLSAEWKNLIAINYAVDPRVVDRYLPKYTELDLWNDTCYVSLVGFLFDDTRMLGIGIPFHKTFVELNLRFYCRRYSNGEWRRGVVFIKEIVPRAAITLIANWLYKEHYETRKATFRFASGKDLEIGYRVRGKNGWSELAVTARKEPSGMAAGSEAEFIFEHYWGYTRIDESRTFEYRVDHPKWLIHDVLSHRIDFDFGDLYGDEFLFLKTLEPTSVCLAEGSPVTVLGKSEIK